MAIDKSGWNKKVKVSQSTIDGIKKMGMTKALAGIKPTSGAEYKEAVRRMYGQNRFDKAISGGYAPKSTTGTKPKHVSDPTNYTAKSKNQAPPKTAAYFAGRKPASATPSRAAAAGNKMPARSTSTTTTPKKKSGGFHITPKEVVGTVAALGVLAATRGRGASVAARLSPAVGKLANSTVGRAVSGTTAKTAGKVADKAASAKAKGLVATGKIAARKTGEVSQAQYKAMQAAAKAKGIKTPTADAARKAASKKITKRTAGTAAAAGVTKKK